MPNAYCKQCLIGRKQVIETDVHLSFSCPNAYGLQKGVKTVIQKPLLDHPARCFLYSMNICPDDVSNNMRKLVLTLIQITMHQIWVNRNSNKPNTTRPRFPDFRASITQTKNDIVFIISSIHKKYSAEHGLPFFRNNYFKEQLILQLYKLL